MFVCIIGTPITALAQFPLSLFEIGTSKNGVKRTSNSSTSALHSQVSTKVNMLYVFLFSFVLIGHIRQLVFHVCVVGHAVCV